MNYQLNNIIVEEWHKCVLINSKYDNICHLIIHIVYLKQFQDLIVSMWNGIWFQTSWKAIHIERDLHVYYEFREEVYLADFRTGNTKRNYSINYLKTYRLFSLLIIDFKLSLQNLQNTQVKETLSCLTDNECV